MKRQLSLLAVALLLAQPVLAKDIPLNRAAALANSVTPAASSQAYDDLEQQALAQLRHALQGNAATLTRDRLARTKQNQTQADTAWLKASAMTSRPGPTSRRALRCCRRSAPCRRPS
ncbi:phosphoesterase PA-phosphatase-like protein [Klebsiella pneumoniae]|nr:phosphoesterase PA-phosphatase-like protein [Klebsiella pneumoniae]